MLEAGNISESDLDLFVVTDDVQEVIACINRFYTEQQGELKPNLRL